MCMTTHQLWKAQTLTSSGEAQVVQHCNPTLKKVTLADHFKTSFGVVDTKAEESSWDEIEDNNDNDQQKSGGSLNFEYCYLGWLENHVDDLFSLFTCWRCFMVIL